MPVLISDRSTDVSTTRSMNTAALLSAQAANDRLLQSRSRSEVRRYSRQRSTAQNPLVSVHNA
jgi:hypothetical protein